MCIAIGPICVGSLAPSFAAICLSPGRSSVPRERNFPPAFARPAIRPAVGLRPLFCGVFPVLLPVRVIVSVLTFSPFTGRCSGCSCPASSVVVASVAVSSMLVRPPPPSGVCLVPRVRARLGGRRSCPLYKRARCRARLCLPRCKRGLCLLQSVPAGERGCVCARGARAASAARCEACPPESAAVSAPAECGPRPLQKRARLRARLCPLRKRSRCKARLCLPRWRARAVSAAKRARRRARLCLRPPSAGCVR